MRYLILSLFIFIAHTSFSQGFNSNFNYGIFASSPVAGDLDGDGLDDAAGINFDYSGPNRIMVAIQLATAEADFEEKNVSVNLNLTGRLDVGDLDGDGDNDIIVTEDETLKLHALINDGAANFTVMDLGVEDSYFLKMLDIDGDEDIDIAGINPNTATLYTYLNDGNMNFSLDKSFDSSDDMALIDVADMDNDGDMDIVITFEEFTGDQIILYENLSGTNFSEQIIGTSKFKSLDDVAIGDLNGDGFMDVFGVSNLSNQALLSDGNGGYESVEMPTPGGNLISVEIGDFTGEGRNDFIISSTDGISWFRNVSYQPLLYAEFTAAGVSPNFSFSKTDLGNDGDLDLLISNGDFRWLENIMEQQPNAIFALDNQLVKIYPNPVADYIYIEAENMNGLQIDIVDIHGKNLWKSSVSEDAIDISSWPSGTYVVKILNSATKSFNNSLIIKE